MSVSGTHAYLTLTKSTKVLSFTADDIIKCIGFLIDNSFIMFRGVIYRQVIGIPMGISCGPHLANVFLSVYEKDFIQQLVEEDNISDAKLLSDVCRYQDDCLVINDDNLFNSVFEKIYPPSMKLDRTNISRDKTNYLDCTISIHRGKFIYKSYDKRQSYNFKVINYPDLISNVPIGPTYGVFTSQLLRFCEINNIVDNFKKDIMELIEKLRAQNFNLKVLRLKYLDFCIRYINTWGKYGIDITEFSEHIFN